MKSTHRAVNHRVMHKLNRSIILSSLRKFPSQTRAKLAERTGLTRSTISNLVDELLDKELVYEVGYSASRGGRRGLLLELNPNGGCAIAIKINASAIHCVLANFVGEILWEKRVLLTSTQSESTLELAESLISEAVQENNNTLPLLGIGVGITGIVERDGEVRYSTHLNWKNIHFRERWEEKFNLPVQIENEVSLSALGENHYGSAINNSHFLFVEIGYGVGAGIVIDGKLYPGMNGYAGEIGYIMMDCPQDADVHATRTWESLINIPSVKNLIRADLENGHPSRLSADSLHFSNIVEALHQGDEVVLNSFEHISRWLGVGIASLVNIFDVEIIILGGELGKVLAPCLETVQREIQRYALYTNPDALELRISDLQPDACLMGGVALVFDNILQEPSWQATIE